jgi:exodeoxyribonuclease VII large subunit
VARGYSIIVNPDGKLVRTVSQVRAGDAVTARLSDGELKLRVE